MRRIMVDMLSRSRSDLCTAQHPLGSRGSSSLLSRPSSRPISSKEGNSYSPLISNVDLPLAQDEVVLAEKTHGKFDSSLQMSPGNEGASATGVNYVDFNAKSNGDKNGTFRRPLSESHGTQEVSTDVIERCLRDKVKANLDLVIKGLQLYDYNMDGKVTSQDLRKVLEKYCFKIPEEQFDKLWKNYDFHHTGFICYQDFFRRLGVTARSANTGARDFNWPDVSRQANATRFWLKRNQRNDENFMHSSTYDEIETEFRKRMRTNYLKLKKALLAFDRQKDGFVTIEDLKSVLSNFTLPMSDQIFLHLMGRCGVKATGHVAWELFLEKFQNPVTGANGQTLPIRPNYRIYPAKESQNAKPLETIWTELRKRVQVQYNSLKDAFLNMDKNRDGRVTRKEFRELIEKFILHLDDSQFRELMTKIDPEKNGGIDYHTFLRLFEERETKDSHNRLKSVNKYNRKQKPTLLAWKTIEEILREKITYYWKNVSDWLAYYDRGDDGYLSKATLKKVIDLQVLPTSDEHFDSLINKCTNFKGGKVNYMEFFAKLGVDVSPGDVNGLSSQIADESDKAEMKRRLDLLMRHDQMLMNQYDRSNQMTANEVIVRLKDIMSRTSTSLHKSFLKYDRRNKGQISKKQFREILANLGIFMSEEQFAELMSQLSMNCGHMQYLDFIMNFGDPRCPGGATEAVGHQSNHRVDAVRGDEQGMTAKEAESKLRQKLRENFSNLKEAFYKFDSLRQGWLSMSSFRHMLDSFMISVSDAEFDTLCKNLQLVKDCRITYPEFLARFEQRDSPEGHRWLNSSHRFNEALPLKVITALDAHSLLAQKIHRQWKDLSKAFCAIDTKGKGCITKQDLRDTLSKFALRMEPSEFKKLWDSLDVDKKNYISHQDFLRRIGAPEYAPRDEGFSRNIVIENHKFLENFSSKLQGKHEEISWNQASLAATMPVVMIERLLRDKIRDSYSDFYRAFCKYDTERLGSLSAKDFQKVLDEQHFLINREQFISLMNRIGLSVRGDRINYAEFLQAFEDGRKSSYSDQDHDIKFEKYEKLNLEDAEMKLKAKLKTSVDDVVKTLVAFDKDGSGKVLLSDFRRVLDMFCFVLTDAQWEHIKLGLTITSGQQVDYGDFLSEFITAENNINGQHFQFLQKDGVPVCTPPVIDEVARAVHEAVVSHYHNILRDFEGLDSANSGTVTAEAMRDVLTKHVMMLTDDQFGKICDMCSVTENNSVDYRLFMKLFSEDMSAMLETSPLLPSSNRTVSQMLSADLVRPSTSRSLRAASRLSSSSSLSSVSRSSLRSGSRASTPMVNAEPAERLIKDTIFHKWHEMQKQCREMDVDCSGTISTEQFNDLLCQFGVSLPASDLNDLVTKYDIFENGRFCYRDFIRHFLLTMKSNKMRPLTSREKMPNKKLTNFKAPIQEEEETGNDLLRRLHECVGHSWKEMRKEFRKADPESKGVVPTDDFRRVLRQFSINLSECEFHILQDNYDKNFSDLVNYNAFLKDCLC